MLNETATFTMEKSNMLELLLTEFEKAKEKLKTTDNLYEQGRFDALANLKYLFESFDQVLTEELDEKSPEEVMTTLDEEAFYNEEYKEAA